MQQIDCTIDTRPMADELKTVSRNVNRTTEAVVAMQTAVVAAEKNAADRVCNDVNRGFHALMSSQISQKIAKLQSDVDSHLMRLNQQTKQLLAIKRQMERDYQRTAQRYSKTFNTLNKELRQRVQELDQPIFKFATTEVQVTSNRMSALTGTVPVVSVEAIEQAQRILASNVKYHGLKVLEASKDFVAGMNEQRALTERILLSGQKAESSTRYIPVVISEGNYAQGTSTSVYTNDTLLSSTGHSTVKGEVMQQIGSFEWKDKEANPEIQNEVVRLISESGCSERVCQTISQLMAASEKYQTL